VHCSADKLVFALCGDGFVGRHGSAACQRLLKIPPTEDFLASRGLGHRIFARIAHLRHARFDASSETAGAWYNTSTQLCKIGLTQPSGDRHREHPILAGWRQLGQMRFYAALDPAFPRLNAGAQFFDITVAWLARRLCQDDRAPKQQRY
jgi:hypothetical protein